MLILALPAILYSYELDPKDEGLLPYGFTENKSSIQHSADRTGKRAFSYKSTAFLLIFFIALTHTSITGISQHLPGYAESNALSIQIGGYLLSAVMIGNITFKLIIGSLSDWLGIIKSSAIMMTLNAISIIMLLTLSNPYVLIFSAFLFGTVFTIPAVALPLLTTEMFGKKVYPRVYPILSFAAGLGGAFSMTFVGYAYDFTGSYASAFILALLFIAINIPLLFIAAKHT